jgi:hypothetical protein
LSCAPSGKTKTGIRYNHRRCRRSAARAALPEEEAVPMSHIDMLGILGALAALATIADFVLTWWPRLRDAMRKARERMARKTR